MQQVKLQTNDKYIYFLGKLLVTTGYPFVNGQRTEVIDLSNSENICETLIDFSSFCLQILDCPGYASAAIGGIFQNDKPFICGGWNYGEFSQKCQIFTEGKQLNFCRIQIEFNIH